MINSKKAFEMGLADRLIAPAEFVDDSIKLLENIITGEEKIERKKVDPKMSDDLYNNTKFAIMGRVHSGAMAPYKALDLIKGAAEWSLDEGFEQENQTLADMIKSRQFLSSVYSFDLTQRRAKKLPGRPPKEVKGYSINKIGIIGAGLMASQMALLFAQRFQCPVVMKDIKQEFVDKGLAYVRDQLGKRVKKGKMAAADAKWMGEDLITGTVTYDGFEDCDFVIEAVFEEIGIKDDKMVRSMVEGVIGRPRIAAAGRKKLRFRELLDTVIAEHEVLWPRITAEDAANRLQVAQFGGF